MAYRFGRFYFAPEQGLFHAGRPVPMEPQGLALLGYLIRNRDRVVGRDELIGAIWGDRIVSDAALSTQVRAVRRGLGDDRLTQRFIRTYPKRGFQFTAEVTEEPASGTGQSAALRRPRLAGRALSVLAVAAVAGAGAVWVMIGGDAGPPAPRNLSIAVLPFDNLSGDPAQDYFTDAFTEDMITDLSRIRDAFVIARRTSFTYRGQDVNVTEVADELGVRYVLEGSVRRMGDTVRVNAQLIDGRTGAHIWSDRFDRAVEEVFFDPNAVTGHIASVLKAELRQAQDDTNRRPESMKAFDLALRGNVLLFNPRGVADYQKAHAILSRAVEMDDTIAYAWAGLAFVHYVASLRDVPGVSMPDSKALSLDAAERAVTLDPANAEGHWMIGVGLSRNGAPERGMAACETAREINPNNDCAYVCPGLARMAMGQPEAAIPHFEHALRLNPRFRTFTKHKYIGFAYLHAGRDKDAIEALNRALAGNPDDPVAFLALASAQALDGHDVKANASLQAALTLPGSPPTLHDLRQSHGWMGSGFDRMLDGLRASGLDLAKAAE